MHLKAEQKEIGKENFYAVVGSEHTRRDFLKGSIAAAATGGVGLGGYYFAYHKVNDPVRVGIIGTGDEGGVLIGAHNPDFVRMIAICDVRPYSIFRAFHGDPENQKPRPGLMSKYGWKSEDEAKQHVKVYTDYNDLLKDPDIEGVIIALPLHLHAPVAIAALRAGKHVLTEKLMGHSVHECKEMARVSQQTGKLLATGHQRHYSILYDNAVDTIRQGLIGQVHHIRAQWHRQKDTWSTALPNEAMVKEFEKYRKELEGAKGARFDEVSKKLRGLEARLLDRDFDDSKAAALGYQEHKVQDHNGKLVYTCSPLEEMLRWRLWDRTGGGLMAELGSHQLDASSIFISAEWARATQKKVKVQPLSVQGVGGRHLYGPDRDADDHVYCTFEFPAPGYYQDHDLDKRAIDDPNKKIVVYYSSINGNGFGGYGEVVAGSEGTLILENEKDPYIFKGNNDTKVGVEKSKSGAPTLGSYETGGGAPAAVEAKKAIGGEVSRGYTEEMEHWAWCIRNPGDSDHPNLPRCHPKVAMADAVIALVSNMAIKRKERIEFKPEWFEIDSDETPEGVKPDTARYT